MARYTETIYPVKKLVPLTTELAQAISQYRQNRIASENEAIRRLIEAGLQAAKTPVETDRSGPGGSRKPSAASRARKPAPKAKALPMSREAQLQALREQSLDEV